MDAVTLAAAKKAAKTYTDSVIASLPKGVVYKGAVNYQSDLPASPSLGDCYTVKYTGSSGTTPDNNEYVWGTYEGTNQWIKLGGEGAAWGSITGTLSSQTDLQSALDAKSTIAHYSTDSTASNYATPTQIVSAIQAGQSFDVTHTDTFFGTYTFSNWTVVQMGSASVPFASLTIWEKLFDNTEGLANFALIGYDNEEGTRTWKFYAVNTDDKNNKVTSISSSSTNLQYPSAKAVYDAISDISVYKEITLTVSQIVSSSPLTFELTTEQKAIIKDNTVPVIKLSLPAAISQGADSLYIYRDITFSEYGLYYFFTSHKTIDTTDYHLSDIGMYVAEYVDSTGYCYLMNSSVETLIAGKEDTSNKVTSISSSSTNAQYPSAKCVYDAIDGISTYKEITVETSQILSSDPLVIQFTSAQQDILEDGDVPIIKLYGPSSVMGGASFMYFIRTLNSVGNDIYFVRASHYYDSSDELTNFGFYSVMYWKHTGKGTISHKTAKNVITDTVSVASTGSSSTTVNYITIDGTEYKIGGESVEAFTAAEVDTIFDGVA